jgi:outer membrane protein assembly factor BamB
MSGMSHVSRRAVLMGLTGAVFGTRSVFAQTRLVSKARPLARDAVTHDWTAFLGPTHNAVSTETRLSRKSPPSLVWEFSKGTGYGSPAIAGERLVFLHRLRGEEIVECLHAETGATQWQFRYPTDFEDRYGYNNGPRSSPVIDGGRVYTVGAQGQLHCLDLEAGRVIWKHDVDKEYRVPQDFFGRSSTPLIEGPHLIVSVGAPGGPCVVGFDKTTGREVWRAGKEWGAGYASPIPAVIHGQRRVFVFAGGESNPPAGGLMSIDPANGRVDFSFPWRSRSYESVNASCPVVFDNKVFVSASYRDRRRPARDSAGLHAQGAVDDAGIRAAFQHADLQGRLPLRVRWTQRTDASLACVDASSGKVVWRNAPEWEELIMVSGQPQRQMVGTYRGSLMAVDGQFLCLGELGHLLWMDLTPKGYKEVARARLFAARESWALPVLSRGLLYVVQNTRDFVSGARPRMLCYDLRA